MQLYLTADVKIGFFLMHAAGLQSHGLKISVFYSQLVMGGRGTCNDVWRTQACQGLSHLAS